jgi:hypothetical protein
MKLRGTFTSKINSDTGKAEDQDNRDKHFWLVNEKDKKASFYLDFCDTGESGDTVDAPHSSISIDKPCHLLLECHDWKNSITIKEGAKEGTAAPCCHPWLFGGAEIHSNSRNIEVYAVTAEKGTIENEEYWQTCRGNLVELEEKNGENDIGADILKREEIYKTIVLPPTAKPITILRLHLKLLSLRPAKCTVGSIFLLKVKGRIRESLEGRQVSPEDDGVSNAPSSTNDQSTSSRSHANSNASPYNAVNIAGPDVSKIEANIGHAIGGLTSLIHSVQSTCKKDINIAAGQAQKAAHVQNQTLVGKMMELEQSVLTLKDSLDNLTVEIRETRIKDRHDREERERDLNLRIERALRVQQQEQFEKLEKSIEALMEKARSYTCSELRAQFKDQMQSGDEALLRAESFEKRSEMEGNEAFRSSKTEYADLDGGLKEEGDQMQSGDEALKGETSEKRSEVEAFRSAKTEDADLDGGLKEEGDQMQSGNEALKGKTFEKRSEVEGNEAFRSSKTEDADLDRGLEEGKRLDNQNVL